MSTGRRLGAILAELERGGAGIHALLVLLTEAEWAAFNRGQRLAGDLGYARWRLASGDRGGALAVLRGLAARTGE